MIKVKLHLGDIENLIALEPVVIWLQNEARLENSPDGVIAGLHASYVMRYIPRFQAVRTKVRNKLASQASAHYQRNQRALRPKKSRTIKPVTFNMPEPLVASLMLLLERQNATHATETYRTLLNAAYQWQVNNAD